MNYDLKKRSQAEELWLWRREKGLHCATAAKKLRVGRTTYWKMEHELVAVPPPSPKTWSPCAKLSSTALLALARRRMGKGLYETAHSYGVSHVVFLQLERAAAAELKAWWGRWGFVFP